jgi:hypothetical protein
MGIGSTQFGFKIGILKTAPNLGAVLFEYLLKVKFKNIASIHFIRTTSLFFIIF